MEQAADRVVVVVQTAMVASPMSEATEPLGKGIEEATPLLEEEEEAAEQVPQVRTPMVIMVAMEAQVKSGIALTMQVAVVGVEH